MQAAGGGCKKSRARLGMSQNASVMTDGLLVRLDDDCEGAS
jgi:hypothetical protein